MAHSWVLHSGLLHLAVMNLLKRWSTRRTIGSLVVIINILRSIASGFADDFFLLVAANGVDVVAWA